MAGRRLVLWLQGRVGPVQLGGLRSRAPRGVLLAGLVEQVVADVFEAMGEVEASRAFGDQTRCHGRCRWAASRRAASKARAAARKSPTAHARSASVSRSRCRKLSGASA